MHQPTATDAGSYEEEGDIFFEDLSNHVMQDDTLARLLSFPNVLVTGHQVRSTSFSPLTDGFAGLLYADSNGADRAHNSAKRKGL